MTETGSKGVRENTFNKSEKTKDVRATNIQAAKGTVLPIQPSRTASGPV